jgi:hypothetical protein
MPFATNTNFSSAPNPIDVGQPTKVIPPDLANGFKPEAAIAAEHVNYLFNEIYSVIVRQVVTEYTAPGSYTYTVPAGAVALDVVCVGPGDKGANGGAGIGGGGGRAGMIAQARWSGGLAASYDVTVGSNVSSPVTPSFVRTGGQTRIVAPGGNGASLNLPSDTRFDTALHTGALGGAANSAAAGDAGYTSLYGPGGAGGAVNVAGSGGAGYGAGGGGGRQASGSTAGGGGGGGGFHPGNGAPLASSGSGSTGGNGVSGYVRFIAYCVGL